MIIFVFLNNYGCIHNITTYKKFNLSSSLLIANHYPWPFYKLQWMQFKNFLNKKVF